MGTNRLRIVSRKSLFFRLAPATRYLYSCIGLVNVPLHRIDPGDLHRALSMLQAGPSQRRIARALNALRRYQQVMDEFN